jgi:hypothetical protein
MSSKLKQIFYGIDNYSNKIQKLLIYTGNNKINEIYIYRKPIQKIIKSFLNMVSLNQIEKNLKKYAYDNIFHLFLIVKNDYEYILIEKNEILNIDIIDINIINNFDNIQYMKIDNYNDNITLNDLLNNTLNKIGSYNFFNYDSRNLNCQKFIMDILISNNLINNDYKKFIYQNPYEIYEKTGILSSFNKIITNIGSTYKIIKGEGLNKQLIKNNEFNLLTKNKQYILYNIIYDYNYFKKNENEILNKMKENNININNYNYKIIKKKIKYIVFHNDIKYKLNYDKYLIKDFNKYITFIYFLKII